MPAYSNRERPHEPHAKHTVSLEPILLLLLSVTVCHCLLASKVPVHDKTRRDQIGAELRLLKHCRADFDARGREEAKGQEAAQQGG